ncbi:MAG: hypothetical protein DMF76_08735 [Acidobacteria bacterium]|nr:MAG: hypothetical protein DMF76_08735 [Acidobacteriota bacterium]
MPKPLVVFDCVIFVQALIKKSGPAARCLELFERESLFSLAVSRETLSELQNVLSRSELRQEFSLITDEKVSQLIDLLLFKGNLFRNVFLVTRDTDLLDLMRWDTEESRDFQRRFRHLKILDPTSFLREITPSA